MRLMQLILERFGHFSDKSFDFGQKQPGKSDFHIFYGLNEAGKTTIMEAWLRLLFGIRSGRAEHYAFKHGRQNLKISAVVEEGGEQHFFARIPQGHGSVLQDKAGAILPAYNLQRFLPPALADEQHYRNLLCLDDEVIEQGEKSIIASEGSVRNLLFSSAAGLPDFSEQLQALENEADALYKPRARSAGAELAQLNAAYEEIAERIEAQIITAPRWQEMKQQAGQSLGEERRIYEERRALSDKIAALKAALETESRSNKAQREFDAALAEMAEKLSKCGIAGEYLQAENGAELYRKLRASVIAPQKLEELRAAMAQRNILAEKLEESREYCLQAEEKYAAAHKNLTDLQAVLPPPAQEGALNAAFAVYNAGQLKRDYSLASERQNDARSRLNKALNALATVKGEHFSEVPRSKLSAREAEAKLQILRQTEAEYETLEDKNIELSARLKNINGQIAASEGRA